MMKFAKAVGSFILSIALFAVTCVGLGFWWSVAKRAFELGSF